MGGRVGGSSGGGLRRGLGGDVGGDIVCMCSKASRANGWRGAGRSGGCVGRGRSRARAAFELRRARVDSVLVLVLVQCSPKHLVAVDLFRRHVVEDDGAHVKLEQLRLWMLRQDRLARQALETGQDRSDTERNTRDGNRKAKRERGVYIDDEGLGPRWFKTRARIRFFPGRMGSITRRRWTKPL